MTILLIQISILLNCDKSFRIKSSNKFNIKVTFPEMAVLNYNIHRSILKQHKPRNVMWIRLFFILLISVLYRKRKLNLREDRLVSIISYLLSFNYSMNFSQKPFQNISSFVKQIQFSRQK